MAALPVFAPDGVEKALATQSGTIPQLAAQRFGQPAKFTVAGGTAPFTSSIGNDMSQEVVYGVDAPPLGSFGNVFWTITCTLQTTNQSISYEDQNSNNCPDAFVAPNLISVDPNDNYEGSIVFSLGNPTPLTWILFPVLKDVGNTISITSAGSSILVRCEFPLLQACPGGITINSAVLLHNLSFPQYIPGNNETDDFSGNALNVASVNGILIQWAKNTSFTGTLSLSGGTNAAPTGAGITAKSALTTQGATVTTN